MTSSTLACLSVKTVVNLPDNIQLPHPTSPAYHSSGDPHVSRDDRDRLKKSYSSKTWIVTGNLVQLALGLGREL